MIYDCLSCDFVAHLFVGKSKRSWRRVLYLRDGGVFLPLSGTLNKASVCLVYIRLEQNFWKIKKNVLSGEFPPPDNTTVNPQSF